MLQLSRVYTACYYPRNDLPTVIALQPFHIQTFYHYTYLRTTVYNFIVRCTTSTNRRGATCGARRTRIFVNFISPLSPFFFSLSFPSPFFGLSIFTPRDERSHPPKLKVCFRGTESWQSCTQGVLEIANNRVEQIKIFFQVTLEK